MREALQYCLKAISRVKRSLLRLMFAIIAIPQHAAAYSNSQPSHVLHSSSHVNEPPLKRQCLIELICLAPRYLFAETEPVKFFASTASVCRAAY